MSDIDNIVQVVIDRQTQSVTQAGFGTPAIISEFLTTQTTPAFDRARFYSSLEEMTTEGWSSGDDAYDAAVAIFSQNPKVPLLMVGRVDVLDADMAEALDAINLAEDEWYFGILTNVPTLTNAVAEPEFAAWIETQTKLGLIQSGDTDILDSGSTSDIAYVLNAAAYERTGVIYHLVGNVDEWANAAWAGECLPFDPGSQTWAYKTLAGVTFDKLTTGESKAALDKKANTYQRIGGVNITRNGTNASGEYIDIMRGVDWLTARIQEAIYGQLVNQRKIPYDDSGITLIGSTLDGVLNEAVRAGVLRAGSVVISLPLFKDIPQADKLNRHLPDVTFTADLLGAIHTVKVEGTVTV